MKSIRRSVFETNSSSTHSLSMCAAEDYELWKNGKIFFDSNSDKFVTMEDVAEKFPDLNGTRSIDDITDLLKDYGIHTYESYFQDGDLEDFSGSFTTKSGEKIIAFGKYGYNG